MKLTSKQALEMLENERENKANERWIDQSICVGNTAETIQEH